MEQNDNGQAIIIDILRSGQKNKGEFYFQSYKIKTDEPMTVQVLLRNIYQTLDQSLAFRGYHCYMGVCNSCLVRVNGKAVKSCEALVAPGEKIRVEPLASDPGKLIRDLVCRTDF